MIKAIIFDCFGVLTSDRWKEFSEALPDEQREPARQLNHAYNRGHLTKAEFLDQIEELTGSQPNYVDDMLDNETTKNNQLLSYVADLKDRGYKIGLLSNVATNWIRDYFLTEEEQGLFDTFVFSFEAGMTKPNPQIFQLTAERLGQDAKNCVLIDDVESYCSAARQEGMKAINYTDFESFKTQLEELLSQS
ncbi:MAG TPA: HAD family phosphatase [Candidatus Saccharimonadales bacterium]|nr:HAD family phosphatase [Candidatus Saccharimonadales bacterium]